ncbi:MAG TPA: T9SS type A sorting domain-containing protein, partial [Bacteroidia bacterium]|nr:T9SS type A sorting domain-containing protein [Bacteroidia bacterium]
NVLYLATGTHNMDMMPNSIGVFKSIDGGSTWNPTGLTFASSALVNIGDLVMNPLDHNALIAASTDGLYRTYDGGATWTRIVNDVFCSVRFKPGDTASMYAVGAHYYRTDDSWTNWAMITSTFVDSYTWKYEYAVRVSASTPNVVYLMTAGNSIGPGIRSYIHKSTDGGWSFTVIDSLFSESQVQFEVAQQTPDKYMIGFYHMFKRENAMSALQQITYTSSAQSPYVHSDQRGIFFDPRNDNVIYLCNDGGLKRSTDNGVSFQNLNANMQLSHVYNFGQSQNTGYKILPATLDVPPYLIGTNGIYRTFPFVEAFICAMSPVNDSVYMIGHFTPLFTSDDWATSYQSTNILLGNASNFPKAFQYSQTQENENFMGQQSMIYKSTDFGQNHLLSDQLSFFKNDWLYELDVSGANSDYMFMRFADSLYGSTDGVTFQDVGVGLPLTTVTGSALTIHPVNPENVWITFSGYSAANKVFFSPDAGQTWINMSAGIPNVPVNDIVCQAGGPPGAVYAATDGGVFYRDSTFSSWQYYNTGLPSVIVTDLDIQYGIGKLRASTFGRGMWESDLYAPSAIAEPNPSASGISIFPNPAVNSVSIQSAGSPLGTVRIFDISGRIVHEFSTQESSSTIDVSGFAAGCYFIRVQDEVHKLLKR